jgi:hypothetical protein
MALHVRAIMPLIGLRVSGRYAGAAGRDAVELRVDVDGPRTTRRVSADFTRDGRFFGSMRIDAPQIAFTAGAVNIVGAASFSWPRPSCTVRVAIPREPSAQAHPPATLSLGAGARYLCDFESPSFRRVELQESYEADVTRFASYDTGALPCTGPARELSIQSAYREAGIELVSAGPANVVENPAVGFDRTWNDAELQAAMRQYFSRLDDRPQWAIWLLHAWSHEHPGVYGLMFDRRGPHRQGCVVFYEPISGTDAPTKRVQLHTCVHELGHGFNLLHSWQKSRARPPVPSRPAARSWMNYPHLYPGGEAAFWPRFAFEFDDLELAHLRHAFEEDVIMGGHPFEGGAASTGGVDRDPISVGLRMRISAPSAFGVGVPVTIAIQIAATAPGQRVPSIVGPRAGNLEVLIRRPGGGESPFEPLLVHCNGDATTVLQSPGATLRDNAFIHYGKDGFAFERPGRYAVRARHAAVDGSIVLSNVLTIEVLAPLTRADREIGRLVSGNDDVGELMALAGSAAPSYDGANRVLDEVVERFPTNAAAHVARVVRATSLARPFKLLAPGERLQVRPPDVARARALIAPVIDLAAIDRTVLEGLDVAARRRAVAATLARIGTRRGITAVVQGFVASRLVDVASAIADPHMTRRRPHASRQLLANWPPGGRQVTVRPRLEDQGGEDRPTRPSPA